ncbi:NAD(P)H-dependent flavin oxidoreductase [Lysobacter soli]|uniref:NAD(P)H-dependent flavin oxidoreductase n=1 Tax=Lysobacter soli TaxID=453783 RepID=UPI0024100CCC|nr:nitronate monooxygenase [Lysobacter soli]MDG2517561.1 nitronate monooxygenase [Lysobacter soli]
MTSITDLFGLSLPVVQAPMAGVQGASLALAVAQAGGLGSLPAATLTPEALRRDLAAIRERSAGPINVNFFCHTPPEPDAEREAAWRALLAPYYAEFGLDPAAVVAGPARTPFNHELADVLAELPPAIVSFHFGLPAPELLERVRATGAKVLSSATTVDEARWLDAQGVDAIVAQGLEAGGHRGHFLSDDLDAQAGTYALLPHIVRAVRVPVIAAGGIADAAGVAAARALGAAGVQVGTAYLLCPEATTSAVHRQALTADAGSDTALTNLFTGRPARGIHNRLMRELGAMRDHVPAFPLAAGALAPLRGKAEAMGRGDFSPLWAGQNTTGCRAVPAAEITRDLARGW